MRIPQADPPLLTAPPTTRVHDSPEARLTGIRVLVVDDELDARELFESVLSHAGATVRTAACAADALQLLRDDRFDVLVCDIEMPGEDGYGLLRTANADSRIRPFAAVAVTAHARAVDRERTAEAGFLVHVAKPVEPRDLIAAVASVARHGRPSAQTL